MPTNIEHSGSSGQMRSFVQTRNTERTNLHGHSLSVWSSEQELSPAQSPKAVPEEKGTCLKKRHFSCAPIMNLLKPIQKDNNLLFLRMIGDQGGASWSTNSRELFYMIKDVEM